MPGKTNPTQCEALTMVAPHSFLELNVFNPVIIVSLLQSCLLPADAAEGCAADTVNRPEPNREHIAENRAKTPMLVTALNPRIGYDKAVSIGKVALAENVALKDAAAKLGFVRPEDFDRWVVPAAMTEPGATWEGGGG